MVAGNQDTPTTSQGSTSPRGERGAQSRQLQGAAATSRQTLLRTRPFRIVMLATLSPWDPTTQRLPARWKIHDPNARIRRGRLWYELQDPTRRLHQVDLSASRLTHGVEHSLTQAEEWDGTLPASFGRLAGTKITADMGEVYVVLEVWNTSNPEPAAPDPSARGRTTRAGEWVDRAYDRAQIDVLVRAKWESDFCIPYQLNSLWRDEERHGRVEMDIRVKNLKENQQVRIDVCRIGEVDHEVTDIVYASSHEEVPHNDPNKKGAQTGLLNPVVRNGRVVLQDGSKPSVTFNRYEEHWKHEGNNFYCFKLYPDPRGHSFYSSERNKQDAGKRRDCLHMRYTVLILAPAPDLGASLKEAQRLYSYLKGSTRYFRPFLLKSQRVDFYKLVYTFVHQYAVVFTGHSGCNCHHAEHPRIAPSEQHRYTRVRKRVDGRMQWVREERGSVMAPVMDELFAPYMNWCPPKDVVTEEDQRNYDRLVRTERKEWRKRSWQRPYADNVDFGWCRHREKVRHHLCLNRASAELRDGTIGQGKSYFIHAVPRDATGSTASEGCAFEFLRQLPGGNTRSSQLDIPNYFLPRFLFMGEGCKTMLTTNLGRAVCNAGTRYFTGWQYVSFDNQGLVEEVFKKWIALARDEPEPENECLPSAFPFAYRQAAAATHRAKRYPTMMDRGSMVRPVPEQGQLGGATA